MIYKDPLVSQISEQKREFEAVTLFKMGVSTDSKTIGFPSDGIS